MHSYRIEQNRLQVPESREHNEPFYLNFRHRLIASVQSTAQYGAGIHILHLGSRFFLNPGKPHAVGKMFDLPGCADPQRAFLIFLPL
jgi:hypothetical protein